MCGFVVVGQPRCNHGVHLSLDRIGQPPPFFWVKEIGQGFQMEWYKWYPAIYEADTEHLTAEQDGIYRRLIDRYMRTRQPLPDNDIALARIAGVSVEAWTNASGIVKAYFRHSDGKLYHDFCDNQLSEQDEKASKKSMIGKIGAEKRWKKNIDNKQENASGIAYPLPKAMQDKKRRDRDKNNITTPDGVSDQLWNDFKAHRRAKKATITDAVINTIKREADKAGFTLSQAMEEMILRGWTGFKAEWVAKDKPKPQTHMPTEQPRRMYNPELDGEF